MQRSSMLFNLLAAASLVGLLSGCGSSGGTTSGTTAANAAPVINSAPPLDGTLSKPYSYDVNASDADGDSLTYSLVAPVPFGMTIDPATGVISWTPTAQEGDNLVTVQVTDGNVSSTQSFTVTVVVAPNQVAPVLISPVTLPAAFVNTAYSTTVIATDGNNDAIIYSITAPPTGSSLVDMTIDPASGVISWTPDVTQVGDKTVTVEAQDSTGRTTSQTFTISVNQAAAASGVTFGFDDLTRGGFNVTQQGFWTNEGPDAFSTSTNGSAIIARRDLEVEIHNGRPRFIQPEFTFLGVTLINRGITDTTFAVIGYNDSHGVTTFKYTVTLKAGAQPLPVLNSLPDDSGRPMNVPVERLEVNGVSLSPSKFGVSCLGVGTAGGAPTCP